jgi:hypothetical protein
VIFFLPVASFKTCFLSTIQHFDGDVLWNGTAKMLYLIL